MLGNVFGGTVRNILHQELHHHFPSFVVLPLCPPTAYALLRNFGRFYSLNFFGRNNGREKGKENPFSPLYVGVARFPGTITGVFSR